MAALGRLSTATAELKLLTCHLTFFRQRSGEFYEPGDLLRDQAILSTQGSPHLFSKIAVVTLIDDIFDMYRKLSAPGAVFDICSAVEQERRRRQAASDPSKSEEENYILAFGQVTTILLRLLDWRAREIAAGEALANRAAADHFLVATKHRISTVANLILAAAGIQDTRTPVYLSHPISRPRKAQKQKKGRGEWPAFVTEYHEFVEALSNESVDGKSAVPIMPTAIDEYRFRASDDPGFPGLYRRWPLVSEDPEALLYDVPKSGSYDDFDEATLQEALFNPPVRSRRVHIADGRTETKWIPLEDTLTETRKRLTKDAIREIRGLLGGVIQQIRLQLAARDHALVRHTGSFVLYRPFADDPVLSGGVGAELKNWSGIVSLAKIFQERGLNAKWRWGRVVFVHSSADAAGIAESEFGRAELAKNLAVRIQHQFGEETFKHVNVATLIDSGGKDTDQCVLSEDDLLRFGLENSAELVEALPGLYEEARKRTLDDLLTGGMRGGISEHPEWRRSVLVERLAELTHDDRKRMVKQQVLPELLVSDR